MTKPAKKSYSEIPVVILCGGMGTRLAEETETKPKPLVEIGGKPILLHIMQSYAHFGFKNFVLCLGYKGQMIRDFFLNYDFHAHDIRVKLGSSKKPDVTVLGHSSTPLDWTITLADTGADAMTGARVKRIEKYIESDHFLLTYGDGVSNVDLAKLTEYHLEHGHVGTVTGVKPTSRFGELIVSEKKEGYVVSHFVEKPKPNASENNLSGFINGGFFAFSKEFFKYLKEEDSCILEREPLEKLSRDKNLMMFSHQGFWQCMDTMRDVLYLRELYRSGSAPWSNVR